MSKYEVQDAPVSYKDRLYSKGEILEAQEDDMEGFVQAGYVVAAAEKPKATRRRSKK